MDNASSPLTLMPDGKPISEIADMVGVSLHETKAIGRGEGGLLLVPKDIEPMARCAINFGYDAALPPHLRSFHVEASNWRMGDFQAAAILTNWELGFDAVLAWMEANDGEVVDIGPFKRGLRGSDHIVSPRAPAAASEHGDKKLLPAARRSRAVP